MTDRTIVITGATDGLGRALATVLAREPDTLILHGRNQARLDELAGELADAPAVVHTVRADLAELAQVDDLADAVAGITDRVTVLVNNAGIGGGEPDGEDRRVSADGYELRFAVNHLAAFALTQRLLPLLERGAPARVVNVASLGQVPMDFDDPFIERDYSGARAYRQSKLAMITTGFTLAERLDAARVTVNSLHPATYMPTKMVLEWVGHSVDSLETGVAATLRLILDPELDGVTGEFFDRMTLSRALPEAYDPEVRRRLWDLSVRLTERAA
ncbi:SDR family NAD(P)-dependent oxidoreductase [Glycomyces algeriensis]|uniref:Oxidoreductase n=1 Tax=Glycomyces algeriensis TaxID=256037 RepID=A0A9W6GB85_9ACTN|nr:SDR family NAD(P)-dependent oxidoreductase [Glycomyces algeriensis]MDA1367325.1 SDR family NAD(P)-dependent oxidoreductase [Glycomyces algeriensis]MDR7351023.1 NAD(P)-dependent dehydrogenase (short-subunit alcohol dehydrogenase family) [Glycomyces algeriensis]GLI43736.1 oxidoreductase [Glycomyces algeriensis]